MILPPGTILQLMYLKERLRRWPPGTFVEVGIGQGHVSRCLLEMGWKGIGYEVDPASAQAARALNAQSIEAGRYQVVNGDWLRSAAPAQAQLVISSMVLEHLDDDEELAYLRRCREVLAPSGLCILFVPGSPRDWGVEDDIAGHHRRYSFDRLQHRAEEAGCEVRHLAGLIFPLSNLLLPISNLLVRRHEAANSSLSMQERTEASGRRNVPGKTSFPAPLALLLNETTMLPFYLLQKLFRRAQRALVIYMECTPRP